MEIAISTLVFWIMLQLTGNPDTATLSGVMAMMGFRALEFETWDTNGKQRPPDRVVPVLSLGHAMAWFQIYCLASWAAYLKTGRTDKIINLGLLILLVMALITAAKYAWLMFNERKG